MGSSDDSPTKVQEVCLSPRRVWLHPTMRTWFRGLGQVQWSTPRCQGIHHTIEARPPFGRWMLSSCDTHVELWGRYGVSLERALREVPLCSLLITRHRWVAGNAGHTLSPSSLPGSAHVGTGSQRNPVSTDDTPPRQHLEDSSVTGFGPTALCSLVGGCLAEMPSGFERFCTGNSAT